VLVRTGHTELLGELQLSFVTFLIGQGTYAYAHGSCVRVCACMGEGDCNLLNNALVQNEWHTTWYTHVFGV